MWIWLRNQVEAYRTRRNNNNTIQYNTKKWNHNIVLVLVLVQFSYCCILIFSNYDDNEDHKAGSDEDGEGDWHDDCGNYSGGDGRDDVDVDADDDGGGGGEGDDGDDDSSDEGIGNDDGGDRDDDDGDGADADGDDCGGDDNEGHDCCGFISHTTRVMGRDLSLSQSAELLPCLLQRVTKVKDFNISLFPVVCLWLLKICWITVALSFLSFSPRLGGVQG